MVKKISIFIFMAHLSLYSSEKEADAPEFDKYGACQLACNTYTGVHKTTVCCAAACATHFFGQRFCPDARGLFWDLGMEYAGDGYVSAADLLGMMAEKKAEAEDAVRRKFRVVTYSALCALHKLYLELEQRKEK